jgi:arginine deiminase
MDLRIESELGRLSAVLVHRPGPEIDRMSPSLMERLLFDDILDGEQARAEHDLFCAVLERAGVRALRAGALLAEALAVPAARRELLAGLAELHAPPPALLDELAALPPAELAAAAVAGLRTPDGGFRLDPIPNWFFQRDCQVVLGDRVLIPAMATPAREREPLLARVVFGHHPELAGAPIIDLEASPHPGAGAPPPCPYPTLEGGDLLVAGPEVLLVGVSERTNRWGVESLAEHLRSSGSRFRHLVVVEIPVRRSFMHLDTVFTFIDRGVGLGYLPVVEPGRPESAHVYGVDLAARELSFAVRPSLVGALEALGIEVDLVPCGGGADPLDQEREQWTDGANAFAAAPGLVFLYRRNRRTLDELDRRGWRVLCEDEARRADDLIGGPPTVVALASNELSRARGGPRCMTMPLTREPL